MSNLSPDLLLRAYAVGVFPMADGAHSADIYWFDPEMRGILPLDKVHFPRRLLRTVRQGHYDVRVDSAFDEVIDACAQTAPGRLSTWINGDVKGACKSLADAGFAHSVECWKDGTLVGGLYGVAMGGAFFGESMFHRERDASKVALVHLVARLVYHGFALLDTQFVNHHLEQFGAIEIPREEYRKLLIKAMPINTQFADGSESLIMSKFLQSNSHTS